VLRAVWEHIDGDTRSRMRAGGKLGTHLMDATLQQLNLVLDTVELPGVAPADGRSLAMRNRELLDSLFADCIRKVAAVRIRVATQPEGTPVPAGYRSRPPLHIVNMALNLVSGQNLAWQQRKAQSFTCSPLHAGSPFVGYRQSRTYGGPEGVSLGTAVTISGAAASPNMGYHSSPALGFILTLFNVRLGWWLGNPGPAGRRTGHLSDPGNTLVPMMREVVGKTDDRSPYVYLSDGGHFENLGIYEMVLRRCHYIVVSDAGCDPKYVFEDLGNAIRKVRTDLGIPIQLGDLKMLPRKKDAKLPMGDYVAIGTIDYKQVDGEEAVNGKLIYVKPGVYRESAFPKDVYNYAKESQEFPHESTADQFFSESQFESYRALGEHVIADISAKAKAASVAIPTGKKKAPVATPPRKSYLSTLVDGL
jgi:hypothetical protein